MEHTRNIKRDIVRIFQMILSENTKYFSEFLASVNVSLQNIKISSEIHKQMSNPGTMYFCTTV